MAVFAYLYFNNVVARQTVTVGYMLQKSLQLDGDHMLELFTKLGAQNSTHVLFGQVFMPEVMPDRSQRLRQPSAALGEHNSVHNDSTHMQLAMP